MPRWDDFNDSFAPLGLMMEIETVTGSLRIRLTYFRAVGSKHPQATLKGATHCHRGGLFLLLL
ncbi:MAG: hypothetical protein ACYSSM_04920 [Planctomycetota bacterium]